MGTAPAAPGRRGARGAGPCGRRRGRAVPRTRRCGRGRARGAPRRAPPRSRSSPSRTSDRGTGALAVQAAREQDPGRERLPQRRRADARPPAAPEQRSAGRVDGDRRAVAARSGRASSAPPARRARGALRRGEILRRPRSRAGAPPRRPRATRGTRARARPRPRPRRRPDRASRRARAPRARPRARARAPARRRRRWTRGAAPGTYRRSRTVSFTSVSARQVVPAARRRTRPSRPRSRPWLPACIRRPPAPAPLRAAPPRR